MNVKPWPFSAQFAHNGEPLMSIGRAGLLDRLGLISKSATEFGKAHRVLIMGTAHNYR